MGRQDGDTVLWMWSALLASPAEIVGVALAAVALAVAGLGLAIYKVEGAGEPRTPPSPARPVHAPQHRHLSATELTRLAAFRPRARLMAGEPLKPIRWWRKIRLAWKDGYAGWILACLAGAFSMATHFGAFWLIAGGGWPGAIAITLLSTAVMVALCAWIGVGLISGH